VTPLALAIAASAASFALGALVGYLLRRPLRRRSSIQLSIDSTIQRNHGRHRR
jgi:hypothetical protein